MKKWTTSGAPLAITAILLILGGCASTSQRTASSEGEVLFDGKNIKQWIAVEGGEWSIEDGVLVGRNGQNWSTDPEKSGSWLRTKKMYANFELEFEYAISEKGNSGVFFRSAAEKNPAFTGYEMQIVDFFGREPSKSGAGALYDIIAPTKNLVKRAGEFNHVVIRADGPWITIEMNGEKVLNFVGHRQLEGYIGLQNHDARAVVRFRDIRVRRL